MIKPSFYFILLLSFLIDSCSYINHEQSKVKESCDERFINSNGIHPVIYDSIRTYIRKNDIIINGKPILYYTLLTTHTDTGNLITLWRSSLFPSYIDNIADEYDFYLYEVDKRKVILVSNIKQDSLIFDKTVERLRKAEALSMQKVLNPVYDGDWEVVSFLVIESDNNIYIKPINYLPKFF